MLYKIARMILMPIFYIIFPWRVTGRENVPAEGPLVVCANHITWQDPIILALIIKRPIHFMAKEELFRIGILRWLLPKVHAFPVKRGTADRTAIRHSLEVLKQGEVLGIFPEGTRSRTGEMQKLLPGVAMLAIKGQAPVIPIAIRGPYRVFRPLHVTIGQPLDLQEYAADRLTGEVLDQAAGKIEKTLYKLLATEPK